MKRTCPGDSLKSRPLWVSGLFCSNAWRPALSARPERLIQNLGGTISKGDRIGDQIQNLDVIVQDLLGFGPGIVTDFGATDEDIVANNPQDILKF